MRRRAAALGLLLCFAACAERGPNEDSAAERAAGWLWSHQQPDGSWRSDQYAVLRSGQALTPFVLHALLELPAVARPAGAARALDFVRRSIGPDGAIGYGDPELLEYPVYSTSIAILVLAKHGEPGDSERIRTMADWLARQQCGEERGFMRGSPAYGAFGFGARGLGPGDPGHVDLAHTRFALQALGAAGRLDEPMRERALALLRRLQHPDGGLAFSPVIDAANKAGRDNAGRFRSYATATADGVLALQALGVAEDDPLLAGARAWLAQHANAQRVGGIDDNPPEPWHDALRFYHAMVLAEAFPRARTDLALMLAARQARDGSFACPMVTAMKEDEPVLATALALRALVAR